MANGQTYLPLLAPTTACGASLLTLVIIVYVSTILDSFANHMLMAALLHLPAVQAGLSIIHDRFRSEVARTKCPNPNLRIQGSDTPRAKMSRNPSLALYLIPSRIIMYQC